MRVHFGFIVTSLIVGCLASADHTAKKADDVAKESNSTLRERIPSIAGPAAITSMSFPVYCIEERGEKKKRKDKMTFSWSNGKIVVQREFTGGVGNFVGDCEIARPNHTTSVEEIEDPTQDMKVKCNVAMEDGYDRVELVKDGSTGEMKAVVSGVSMEPGHKRFEVKFDDCYEENVDVFTAEQTTKIWERAMHCAAVKTPGQLESKPSGTLVRSLERVDVGRGQNHPIEMQNIIFTRGASPIKEIAGQVLPELVHMRRLKSSEELCEEITALVEKAMKD